MDVEATTRLLSGRTLLGRYYLNTRESCVRIFEPHGHPGRMCRYVGADLSYLLAKHCKAGQTDRNGPQAGRGRGRACVGEGVLADTALIGFPELVPHLSVCRRLQLHKTAARLTDSLGLCTARGEKLLVLLIVLVLFVFGIGTVLFQQHCTTQHASHHKAHVRWVGALDLPIVCVRATHCNHAAGPPAAVPDVTMKFAKELERDLVPGEPTRASFAVY